MKELSCLLFSSPTNCAKFAAALHTELLSLPWQDELRSCDAAFEKGLCVAIGSFTGSYTSRGPHASTGRADYFGTMVNRTARIAQAAHAGQTLFGAVQLDPQPSLGELMPEQLPPTMHFERLGLFAFKVIEGPLAVHELRYPGVEACPEPRTKGRVGE